MDVRWLAEDTLYASNNLFHSQGATEGAGRHRKRRPKWRKKTKREGRARRNLALKVEFALVSWLRQHSDEGERILRDPPLTPVTDTPMCPRRRFPRPGTVSGDTDRARTSSPRTLWTSSVCTHFEEGCILHVSVPGPIARNCHPVSSANGPVSISAHSDTAHLRDKPRKTKRKSPNPQQWLSTREK